MDNLMPHWLTKQAALSPEKIAIELEDDTTITFTELKNRSREFAQQLAGIGVNKGAKVAILSENHLDMAVAIHALSYLQAVAVLLNTKLTNKELTLQLNESEAMLLLQTESLKQLKKLPYTPQQTFTEVKELQQLSIALTDEIALEAPFTMMFTSGTTGKPKRVIHTYGNHWWSAIGSTLNLGLHQDDKWLLTLPMYHVGGLSILLRSVITGMEVYLMEKYRADLFLIALKEKKITIASIVTVMLKDLLAGLETEILPNQVRCLLLGGGSVPSPLLKKVKHKALPLFQSYGMTETSSQIVTLSADHALKKIGSSGKPLFPAQVKITEENKSGIGEIVVKGPMVFAGYENRPKANETSFSDGWFKTGDLGYIDKEGFLFVMERRTDLIISGGENIYPREIENIILELDAVEEVAAVAKADATWGQVPVVFIVVSGASVTEAMIFDYLKPQLASFKLPKEIHFIQALPKNATNKIMRHKLKEML